MQEFVETEDLLSQLKAFQQRADNVKKIRVAKKLGLRKNLPLMHFHETSEVFFQITGRREFIFPHEMFSLNPGEAAIIPPGVPHAEKGYTKDGLAFCGLVFGQTPQEISIHRSEIQANAGKPFIFKYKYLESKFEGTIRQLTEALPEIDIPEVQWNMMVSLIGLIADAILQPSRKHQYTDTSSQLVGKVQASIDSYLADSSLTVVSLASDAGCTADHLSRCFKAKLGVTTQEYLRQKRLSLAKRLLERDDIRISEVAWSCGFNSLNYFIRVFKEDTGLTPREFRRNLPVQVITQ